MPLVRFLLGLSWARPKGQDRSLQSRLLQTSGHPKRPCG